MCSSGCLRSCGVLLCFMGLALSAYSLYVEMQLDKSAIAAAMNSDQQSSEQEIPFKAEKSYVPLCDIDDKYSCSKVFSSKYATGFGLVEIVLGQSHWLNQRNPIFGLGFYSFMMLLALVDIKILAKLQLFCSLCANVCSLYLSYLLFFVLDGVCVVCMSIHVVNILLLFVSLGKVKVIAGGEKRVNEDKQQLFTLPTTANVKNVKKNV